MDILFTCCKSLFTGLRRDVVCMIDTYLWYFEIWNAYSLSHFYPQHFMRCKQFKQHIWVYNKCYKTIQEVLCHCLNYTNWSPSSHLQCVHVLWNCCQVKWAKKRLTEVEKYTVKMSEQLLWRWVLNQAKSIVIFQNSLDELSFCNSVCKEKKKVSYSLLVLFIWSNIKN